MFKYGIQGKKEFDFDHNQIIQVLPNFMNTMIVELQKGQKISKSMVAIDVYCLYLRLFLRLKDEYPVI